MVTTEMVEKLLTPMIILRRFKIYILLNPPPPPCLVSYQTSNKIPILKNIRGQIWGWGCLKKACNLPWTFWPWIYDEIDLYIHQILFLVWFSADLSVCPWWETSHCQITSQGIFVLNDWNWSHWLHISFISNPHFRVETRVAIELAKMRLKVAMKLQSIFGQG